MDNRLLSEQLDKAIQLLLAGESPVVGEDFEELTLLASSLRDLPREQFREQLKKDLQKGITTMPTAVETPTYIREGFRTITPYLISPQSPALLEFIKKAFAATETMRAPLGGGGLHAEARLLDTMIMVGGGMDIKAQTCALHINVPDVDAVYRRALELGANSLYEPTNHEYGERGAGVSDPFGNYWYIATVTGKAYHWEGVPQVQPYFSVHGTAAFLDFLTKAFGGEVSGRHEGPDGKIAHASVRIGTSSVEAGEARDQYQPLPSMFYMYVEDCDAQFQRALDAGAKLLHPVMDQPYGDRNGAVTDPFGNIWYIATHKGR